MRPSFCPRLVNGPHDDPGLYIPFQFQNRALMFDLGDINALSAREILKISHVFVTHTHMDHFVGFDRMLRLMMGRDRTLHLYGPRGFIRNVEGKLAGYTWNLVENYADSLVLEVSEVRGRRVCRQRYACRDRFEPRDEPREKDFEGPLFEDAHLLVRTFELDHGIPCLGFSLQERFHVNIRKDGLAALKLEPGPWLQAFKTALYEERSPESDISAATSDGGKPKTYRLGDLAQRIAIVSTGQKIGYIADVGFTASNVQKILAHIDRADHLYIEAAFLDEQRDRARLKHHLTARQAGLLAGRARAKQVTPFHFSPRYADCGQMLEAEAQQAFKEALRQPTETPLSFD